MTLLLTAVVSAVVTLIVTILVFNLWPEEKIIQYEITSSYGVDEPQFMRAMGQLLPPPIAGGNKIDLLVNGAQFFPVMLDAIRSAQKTICFETYIYWSGDMAKKFAEALAERSRAGVKVHILIDWVGSQKMDKDTLQLMKDAGAEIEMFHPLHFYNISRFNNRTHRKILVIDGRVGFTGGTGIADEWDGDADNPEHYRDNQYRLEGPAVAQMQSAFMDNWLRTHKKVLHEEDYFPPLEEVGDCRAQVFSSGPQQGSESARLMYLLSIACARKQVLIQSSYFVPDELAVKTLIDAKKRGVDVQIMVPGPRLDAKATQHASRSLWGQLLEAGIAMYSWQPTLFHCKVMIVDGLWTTVGSSNFDPRSFRLNDEVNLNILDADFGRKQIESYERDKQQACAISYEEWKNRPLSIKLKDHAVGLFKEQF